MNSETEKLLFYRGLLFGLRAAGQEEFLAEGSQFHRAFGSTIELATKLLGKTDPIHVIEVHLDPIFGVYPEANEMLLEGAQDTVLSLANPHLRRAKFEMDEQEAQEELERLPRADIFRKLGEHLKLSLQPS
jgi:hypothetical protein